MSTNKVLLPCNANIVHCVFSRRVLTLESERSPSQHLTARCKHTEGYRFVACSPRDSRPSKLAGGFSRGLQYEHLHIVLHSLDPKVVDTDRKGNLA